MWFSPASKFMTDTMYDEFENNVFKITATHSRSLWVISASEAGLFLGLHPATERRRYKVTLSFIGWAETLKPALRGPVVMTIHYTLAYGQRIISRHAHHNKWSAWQFRAPQQLYYGWLHLWHHYFPECCHVCRAAKLEIILFCLQR